MVGVGESSLRASQTAALVCSHGLSGCVHIRKKRAHSLLLIRPPILSKLDLNFMVSFNLNYLKKALPLNTVTLEVRGSI